jgi:hypothetical protein
MTRQWLDERYLHCIHDDSTTNRYQLAGMARQWLDERYLHCKSQQHNHKVPTCWHGQTMARREVSTLHTSQQHKKAYQLASNSNGSTRASILEPTRCIRLAWAQQPTAPGDGSTTDGTNFLADGTRRWLNQQGMYISYII